MRIGIDGLPLAELKTGTGHYTHELAHALARLTPSDELQLISHIGFDAGALADIEAEEAATPNLRAVSVKVNALTRRWWLVGLTHYLRKQKIELFHGTNFQIPLLGTRTSIVTIHDLSILLHPETHEPAAVKRGRLRLPHTVRQARMVITLSESVRSEVCRHFQIAAEKVVAVPLAARDCFKPMLPFETLAVRRRLGVQDEFLLCVGTLEPRKNLARLLAAFEELLRETELRPQLVLVGRRGWLVDDLLARFEHPALRAHLLWTGYISDEDLRALYASCTAFIYPSIYEGFGLPPLEAMSCGAPVITSRIPSIVETVGDAARLVTPTDTGALARSMIELLRNAHERRRLSENGLLRAQKFSWERTAQLTREVYERALAKA